MNFFVCLANYKLICILICLSISEIAIAQSLSNQENNQKPWFIGLDYGVQMSGIKSEDFVAENYSPLIRANVGKWLSHKIGIQIGYQGNHFNTIADNERHYYNFYYTQAFVSLLDVFRPAKSSKLINLNLEVGLGYFKNIFYDNSSIHGILGGTLSIGINKTLGLKFNCGSIIGWDIYQGDQDILPSLSIGLFKILN